MDRPDQSFPRRCRLAKSRDFERVFQTRCSAADGRLVVYAAPNGLDGSRLGLAVSRKLGNAVKRNRYRRLLREAFRLGRGELPGGLDLVLIPRAGGPATLDQYRQSLARLVGRLAPRCRGGAPAREDG